MPWYDYIICYLAGAFLANAVPHIVKGVTGESFPTPFAKPPGRGLSSPVINVLWGFGNIIIGEGLVHVGHLQHVYHGCHPAFIVFFAGALIMSLMLASNFGRQRSH